jgi:hydrogenase expression/formation protein HypE
LEKINLNLSCPIPLDKYPAIVMAHGGGGRLMNKLIDKMLIRTFDNPILDQRHDSAVLNMSGKKIAYTTDSYVIKPWLFPGGDIGTLAIFGTANDLAMSGARPKYLSLGLILEEGFSLEHLWHIVQSMQKAATEAGVQIVTGDTKVVEKGKGDGIFINTSGIGVIEHNLNIGPGAIRQDDIIIINGDLARHSIAVMAEREAWEFQNVIESDCAFLGNLVQDVIAGGIEIHMMRDLTRGGLASALNEIGELCDFSFLITESTIPVREEVRGACEILGLDPLYAANEGKLMMVVREKDGERALEIMKKSPAGRESVIIGKVMDKDFAPVMVESFMGARRILDMKSGEQLPRIC